MEHQRLESQGMFWGMPRKFTIRGSEMPFSDHVFQATVSYTKTWKNDELVTYVLYMFNY